MGNEQTGGEANGTNTRVTGADFEVLQMIGKGAFGKVLFITLFSYAFLAYSILFS